ncbi:polysaccharide biosynthesis/export family protein [uncultured Imperialibacter sp.]|uniref:polysaccharide biosynthesis/export family protein n=1 Tax=uncultured Imperialibacter sp. TaxID=1672639 RepID=UPI0030DCEC77|tara:strand:- start:11043 stop:11867 length:825 start_codon:yes stop_codon:yes gene_type:complete
MNSKEVTEPKKRSSFLMFFTSALFSMLLSGCIPNGKLIYFQGTRSAENHGPFSPSSTGGYRLEHGDIISVEIRSIDPAVTEIFESKSNSIRTTQLDAAANANYFSGYEVKESGEVEIPLIGNIYVKGKTLQESKTLIEEALRLYMIDPFVLVRMGGITYTAFGEFNKPGRYNVLKDRVTIFEAIANAGDLTNEGNRQKVTFIRQTTDGQVVQFVDLTEIEIIDSPFYYIKQGDQIYVEPLKIKEFKSVIGSLKDIAIIVGAVSSIALFFILVNN